MKDVDTCAYCKRKIEFVLIKATGGVGRLHIPVCAYHYTEKMEKVYE